MDENGSIFASNKHEVGRFHHSSLLEGKPVAGAGELEVREGVCTLVTCASGHYQPPKSLNMQVLDELESNGISDVKLIDGF